MGLLFLVKKVVEFDEDYYDEDKGMETNMEEVGFSRKKPKKVIDMKKKSNLNMKHLRSLVSKK